MFVSKISLKGKFHSNNGLLLDVVDIQAVPQDFACLNDSRRKHARSILKEELVNGYKKKSIELCAKSSFTLC